MTLTAPEPRRRAALRFALVLTVVLAFGLGFWIVGSQWSAVLAAATRGSALHAPDVSRLLAQPSMVIAHAGFATAALVLGPVMLLSRKGATFHRRAGWTWAGLMAAAAGSSFLLLDNPYSYIHVMSAITLVLLPIAVHAARRHKVARHRVLMLWLFWVMLVGAALFTLVPGRLVWEMLFA